MIIALGDRRFVLTDFERRTVVQDHHMQSVIRRAGVDTLMPQEGESDPAFLARLDTALLASGEVPLIAAGLLVPEGLPVGEWSRQIARDTADYIGRLDDIDDREYVQELALNIVMGYYRAALRKLGHITSTAWVQGRPRGGLRRFLARFFPRLAR